MKILIVTNFGLTPMQVMVGQSLQELSDVYYLCVSEHTRMICIESGVHIDKIIQLSLNELTLPSDIADKYTSTEFEPPIMFNDLLTIDRYLRHRSDSEVMRYKTLINELVSTCIGSGFFDVVFGESTWTHELALSRACKAFGSCRYFSPHTVRYPSGRWGFFEGEYQENLVAINNEKSLDVSIPSINDILAKKPYYLSLNDEKLKKNSSFTGWLRRFFGYVLNSNMEVSNPCLLDKRFLRLRIVGSTFFNRIWYRLRLNKICQSDLDGKNYVLMTLHKQPESSIDVQSKNFADQKQLAKFIWRKLPPKWCLVIKEHSNAVGDRGRSFFKDLDVESDIFILSEKSDTAEAIKNAQLVFSASGTPCLEAALTGKASLTTASVFFNKLTKCHQLSMADLLSIDDISQVIRKKEGHDFGDLSPKEYIEWIIDNSFEGIWTDSDTLPNSLESKNVLKIINGHHSLLRSIASQEPS